MEQKKQGIRLPLVSFNDFNGRCLKTVIVRDILILDV